MHSGLKEPSKSRPKNFARIVHYENGTSMLTAIPRRVLYFYAYLAEEVTMDVLADADQLTIAPGCGAAKGGKRPQGRCDFNQFCEYIWAPWKGDTQPVGVDLIPKNKQFENIDFNRMAQRVLSAPQSLTGAVNHERLVKGATSWFDALARVGDPIAPVDALRTQKAAEVAQMLEVIKGPGAPTDPTEQAALRDKFKRAKAELALLESIMNNGQKAAELIYQLRLGDHEYYRIREVEKRLERKYGAQIELAKTQGEVLAPGNQPKKWYYINVGGTVGNHVGTYPDIADALDDLLWDYDNGAPIPPEIEIDEEAVRHAGAVSSARRAAIGCGCQINY